MANSDIKKYMREKKVALWRVADFLNLGDYTLSRKMRHELPEYDKKRILEIVDHLATNTTQERNANDYIANPNVCFEPFEGREANGGFVAITQDMMESAAWNDLKLRQWGLYLYLKSKYTREIANEEFVSSNKGNISLPYSEWFKKLYGDGDTFRSDMKALYDHGFIVLVCSGQAKRTCNIYGFSDKWQQWTKSMAK